MSESAMRRLALVAALGAAGCTVNGGGGLDTAGNQANDSCDAGSHGGEGEQVLHSVLGGRFDPMIGYSGIGGQAQMVRRARDEHSRIDVQLTGLPAGIAMIAHVHAAACAFQGGGHYKIDPAVLETLEDNELWLRLATSADGVGTASVDFAHLTRGDALSIVLHDPNGGAKMACADLTDDEEDGTVEMGGPVTPFALAEEADRTLGGTVAVFRSPSATQVYLGIDGLDPAAAYAAHVHALPCGLLDGGGHYKIDPTVVDTVEQNEIWPSVSGYQDGRLESDSLFLHPLRADAQSIVLHRMAGEAKPKVACADLVRREHPARITAGDSELLASGHSRLPSLSASAVMTRALDETTSVLLVASGLKPGASYPVHVHDLPCAVKDGGAHYLIDPAAGAGEANELWLPIGAAGEDGTGFAEIAVSHLARAEAQSLVVHDGADGARLACIDLD